MLWSQGHKTLYQDNELMKPDKMRQIRSFHKTLCILHTNTKEMMHVVKMLQSKYIYEESSPCFGA